MSACDPSRTCRAPQHLATQSYRDLIVVETNQEQGIIAVGPGSNAKLPDLPIGSRVRILPNHACATAAQHDYYNVIADQDSDVVTATWSRFAGW